jgi:CRISPR-associated protein Cmr6
MIHNTCNLGWQYYRNYFKNVDISNTEVLKSENTEELFKKRNKEITDYSPERLFDLFNGNSVNGFKLYTTYPGLLLGAGYEHEISAKGEMKLGFYFDHSSGFPVLPGSSVKGVIRSVFPQWCKHYKTEEHIKWVKTFFIKALLTNTTTEAIENEYAGNEDKKKELRQEIVQLENTIFEGIKNSAATKATDKYYSVYERDIFLDAFIFSAGNKSEIVGIDSITPHIQDGIPYEQAMLKNPTPLPFLKILPNVGFQFNFKLTNNGLDSKVKKKLFIAILTTIGIGAKTNVGYGQLVTNRLTGNGENPEQNIEQTNINEQITEPSAAAKELMKAESEWPGEIVFQKKDNFIIEIRVDNEIVRLKKKADRFIGDKPPALKATVKIKFTAKYNFASPSFEATIL